MAFSPPTFNSKCAIYRSLELAPTYTDVPCNLAFGTRYAQLNFETTTMGVIPPFVGIVTMYLLLPASTDIQDRFCEGATVGDYVECPQGTGRFYFVLSVDDIGKNFPNEHRCAMIAKCLGPADAKWPAPIP